MRRIATIGRAVTMSAILLGLLQFGCTPLTSPRSETTGTLVVKLPHSLGNAARTIVPDFATEIDSVSVTVNAAGRSQQTQTSIATGPVTFTGLAATTWTVDLDVLKGGSVIGSGSGNVSVFSGSTSSVTIPIVFSGFDSGTGTLSLLLSWPSSTGVDYVAWSIDGGSATSAAITTDPGLGLSTTSLSASLGSGAHTLLLSFKAGGATGASAGRFVESIDIWAGLTSDSWIDGSGAVKNAMAFSTGDFLDANANLGDLVVQDGSSSGATLAVGFSSSTTSYDMYAIPSTQSIVFTPTESVAGQYISYSWNGGASTGLPSGTASAALDFNSDPSIYDNALSITVQAPNRATKTYTLTWHSAAITVGVSTATSYEALTFANNNPSVTRGNPIVIETNNSILAALDTGWAWYIDGVKQAETSQRLTLDSATTNSYSVGDHFISVILSYGGVSYAGTLILSIESH